MRFVRRHGSTRGQETRRAQARKDRPPWERPHDPQRSPGLFPESLALFPVTGHAPEGGRTPTAGPEVDPAAPASPPGVVAEVAGDEGEDDLALAAAHTEVTGVTGRTVEVIPEVARIIAEGGPGQSPTTAIPVGVGV